MDVKSLVIEKEGFGFRRELKLTELFFQFLNHQPCKESIEVESLFNE